MFVATKIAWLNIVFLDITQTSCYSNIIRFYIMLLTDGVEIPDRIDKSWIVIVLFTCQLRLA